MNLYFSRNPNPRLAVATARFLKAEVAFEYAEPLAVGLIAFAQHWMKIGARHLRQADLVHPSRQ